MVTPGADNGLTAILLAEVMRDGHRYSPGIEQEHPAAVSNPKPAWRAVPRRVRERCRDSIERLAACAGFSHRHFLPEHAAAELNRILASRDGFEETFALLEDERSRRALVDVLKLRVLGPYHTALRVTPNEFRRLQAKVDSKMRERTGTFEVSDPWFSPLSLYRVSMPADTVRLHCHSVDIVSIFELEQYSYGIGAGAQIRVGLGDVVIDAGGCWGDTALYFASLVGEQGRVYTFEFDAESLEILRANLELNPHLAARIEVVELALWDRSGDTIGYTPAGRCTTTHANGAAPGEREVSTITLDDFVAQAGIQGLGFIKMDVEGAEKRILGGSHASIGRFQPRLAIAAYHQDDDLIELPRAIRAAGSAYRFHLATSSPVEEETVLFAGPADSPRDV